ncbi:MAG: hypothetical protein LBT59_25510 [Clostridiales bacterium]|jgi:hypothetical protein|nr:hypothetical protein [Clostridiales bacterium]
MKKSFINKGIASFAIVAILILGSATALTFAMNASQSAADSETASNTVDYGEETDYSVPENPPSAAFAPSVYQGASTNELMPIDLTLSKADVPHLLGMLSESEYLAAYVDDKISLRVTKEAVIQISDDNGSTWTDTDSAEVPPEDFSLWLYQNDPIPGYSMRELQERLKNGAEVKHIVLGQGKEMYFVIDEQGAQIELVQLEKLVSILVDGQRVMITAATLEYSIPEDIIGAFYDLLDDCGIINARGYFIDLMNEEVNAIH